MKRALIASVIAVSVCSVPVRAQQPLPLDEPFTVGSAAARAGDTAYGSIDVAAAGDAAASIPVAIVRGAKSGLVAAFIAGSHGTEYTSSVALTRLISRIDPASLSGTVIIVPLLNTASFEQMTVHTNPIDRKGMNGQYPGDPIGTQTQRVLAAVTQQIVRRADTIIDLHGGDLDEDLVSYSYWMRSGNAAQDAASRRLALAFGLPRVIVNDVDLSSPASTRSLSGFALSSGRNVVVAEAGASGRVEEDDVRALVEGCLSVLGALHMIEHGVLQVDNPIWLAAGTRVRADAPAMWSPAVRGGTYVSKGMPLGTLTDYLGRTQTVIRSPESGMVTFIRGVPSVWKDATLANVSPVLTEPGPWSAKK